MWIARKYRQRETGRPDHRQASHFAATVCRRRLGWTHKRRAGVPTKKKVEVRP
jgi:hypothetical protein